MQIIQNQKVNARICARNTLANDHVKQWRNARA